MTMRAYSVLNIKAVDDDKRTLDGIASTPTPDRLNDVVVPEGMEFNLPFPFLYQHNSRQPIGWVERASVTKDGMKVKIQMAPDMPAAPWIAEAWALIKAGLIRGLSIGFRSIEESWDKTLNGYKYLKTEIMELSAVTIPANAEATIISVKSIDCSERAAIGNKPGASMTDHNNPPRPGASGTPLKKEPMKTTGEQIAGFEAKRRANQARQEQIQAKAADEGRVKNDAEKQEFEALGVECEGITEEIESLKRYERQLAATAKAVTASQNSEEGAANSRRGIIVRAQEVPKGTAFTRYAIALMRAKGNLPQAAEIAKGWHDSTPEVEAVLKVAVATGTTYTDHWASQIADYTYMASEFIEFLRPQTIIGKLPLLRRVPFNIKMPTQTAGSSGAWVGEGQPKPVQKFTVDSATFRFAKAADIIVLTEELVMFSNPSAEALVRQDLAAGIAQFLDEQFIDPTVTESVNVHPAAITQGAANSAASGTTATDFRNDLATAIQAMLTAEISPSGMVIVMQPTLAVALSLMRNLLGNKEFPDITADGGVIEGYPVVTSNSVPSGVVAFLKQSEIMIADEGGINLDSSREASIVMDDGVSPAGTTLVSLWQRNLVALRAERIINWGRRRTAAVYYLTAAAYGATSP